VLHNNYKEQILGEKVAGMSLSDAQKRENENVEKEKMQ
jgi:hypothetical protein